jgi:hypothetical protein
MEEANKIGKNKMPVHKADPNRAWEKLVTPARPTVIQEISEAAVNGSSDHEPCENTVLV